jgi:rhodanese-related sulfurtransferase
LEETLEEVCRRNQIADTSEVLAHIERSHAQDIELELTPAELRERIERKEDIRLLDIRSREEWDAVRLPGAQFLNQELTQEILGRWPKSTLVVFYDHAGKQSLDAAAYFAGHGFSAVRYLRGGIDAWSTEVDPAMPRYQLEPAAA